MKDRLAKKKKTTPKWNRTAAHGVFFIECAFLFSDIATIVNILGYYMLFKSYACSMLRSFLFFSRSIGQKIHRFSVRCYCDSFRFVSVWFDFFACVWVSFRLRVLLLSNGSMLMIRIILWEKNEKRIKSWSAKLDAIGLIPSVMLFPFRLIPPIDRNLQSDEIRLQCAGPGHRLPHTKIHTRTHSWLFRKRNKILFRAKIYWDIMLSINHIKRTILFVAPSLLYSRPVSTQSLGYRPHIWRIHFVVPCCLLALRHCDVEHTVIHNFMRMMEKK